MRKPSIILTRLGATLALLLGGAAAQAATFTVTSLLDDFTTPGTLRAAIGAATAAPGPHTIVFSNDLSGTISQVSELLIQVPLTINGAGRITLDGGGSSRLIQSTAPLTLDGLTFVGGVTRAGSGGGGAVYADRDLTVTNSTFRGNQASLEGSAIGASGGRVTIVNSTFDSNTTFNGAAISLENVSSLAIVNSTFVNNTGFLGGALYVNVATGSPASTVTITNSTFFGNDGLGGTRTVLAEGNVTVKLANNILAGGVTGVNCSAVDGATLIDLGGNLSNDATCVTQLTSQANTAPLLGALQNNGGPTPTMLPQTGSPAINRGVNALALGANGEPLATDQRGLARIAPLGGTVDVGAVEVAGLYSFTGFLAPVDNLPVTNVLKAGSAVPVKFSLGGWQGLAVLAAGSPGSVPVACTSGAPQDAVTETVAAGSSSLSYDAATGQYRYVWKTDKGWKGTCRRLTLTFNDGSTQSALFQFN